MCMYPATTKKNLKHKGKKKPNPKQMLCDDSNFPDLMWRRQCMAPRGVIRVCNKGLNFVMGCANCIPKVLCIQHLEMLVSYRYRWYILYLTMTLVFLVRSPNHIVEGLMLIMRSGVPSGAKEPHGSLFALNNSSSCHKQKINIPKHQLPSGAH